MKPSYKVGDYVRIPREKKSGMITLLIERNGRWEYFVAGNFYPTTQLIKQ